MFLLLVLLFLFYSKSIKDRYLTSGTPAFWAPELSHRKLDSHGVFRKRVQRYDYFPNQQNICDFFFGFIAFFLKINSKIDIRQAFSGNFWRLPGFFLHFGRNSKEFQTNNTTHYYII